jgi:cob(I)alamin adenosyltransferase
LADGSKTSKFAPRIEAYGTVDELNSAIGMLCDILHQQAPEMADILTQLKQVQNELFDLGGELATPASALDIGKQQVVTLAAVTRLEREIDNWNQDLEPLRNFVLPGGTLGNSTAHLCRTICRRAERRVVELASAENIRKEPVVYLNRLSDWLFVLARTVARRKHAPEVLWNQVKQK